MDFIFLYLHFNMNSIITYLPNSISIPSPLPAHLYVFSKDKGEQVEEGAGCCLLSLLFAWQPSVTSFHRLRLRKWTRPPWDYCKLQPGRHFFFLQVQNSPFRGRVVMMKQPSALRVIRGNWFPFLSYSFFPYLSWMFRGAIWTSWAAVSRCRGRAIISTAGWKNQSKNNLILSGSVKILFAWLRRVYLCHHISWQAGRQTRAEAAAETITFALEHLTGAELKRSTF